MEQADAEVSFYLEKSEADAGGMCPVTARLSVSKYSEAAFSLKLRVPQATWSSGRTSGKSMKAKEINNRLDEVRAMALGIYAELSVVHDSVTADDVKSLLLSMAGEQTTLLSYFRTFTENFARRVGVNRAEDSLRSYRNAYNHMERLMWEKYNLLDIPFSILALSFIQDYGSHLWTDCRLSPGTIINLTTQLKIIVGEAVADGIVTTYPFTDYEPVRPKQKRRCLTSGELQRLTTVPLHRPNLYLTRDLLLSSCYTGVPYSDMRLLSKERLSLIDDGTWWVRSSCRKTRVEFETPLLDLPLHIIRRYRDTTPDGKLLLIYPNSTTGLNLKRTTKLCDIDCPLVFHAGRHIYATEITLGHGAPLETVSKMLRHARIETTQIYTKVTDDKISADTRMLNEGIAERFSVVI